MITRLRRGRVAGVAFGIWVIVILLVGLLPMSVYGSLLGPEVSASPSEAVVGQQVAVQAIVGVGGG